MSKLLTLDELFAAVMPAAILEVPGLAASSEISTRALPTHSSPPRVVWVPTDDQWTGAQKLPRGGGSTGKSVMTCRAGVHLHCWGADRAATWAIVTALVRSITALYGSSSEVVRFERGGWASTTGATTAGELYVLQINAALDVPALPDPPRTATPTSTPLDASRSSTGDGFTDAGETG